MAEDELDELAADIETNGLQQPIVLADFADEKPARLSPCWSMGAIA